MMMTPDHSQATYQIKRYEPGKIWVNETCFEQSLIVRPYQLIYPWNVLGVETLMPDAFAHLFAERPDIVLLGTGEKLIFPAENLLENLWLKGIGIEVMDSRRACFTYTVLCAEERNVAACIIMCPT